MTTAGPGSIRRLTLLLALLAVVLMGSIYLGLAAGSTGGGFWSVIKSLGGGEDKLLHDIIWRLRLPRVLLAAMVGAALSLGGLVFQALLKNPLAEPYILGISGGAAIGAITGIILGLSRIPGVGITAFTGSLATLSLILVISSGRTILVKDALLLSGYAGFHASHNAVAGGVFAGDAVLDECGNDDVVVKERGQSGSLCDGPVDVVPEIGIDIGMPAHRNGRLVPPQCNRGIQA